MLNELWELKKAGFVDKSAYTWRVADNNVQQEQSAQAELPEETTTMSEVMQRILAFYQGNVRYFRRY
ncbi:TPA: hypothetical protein MD351_003110 [Escherichia coli]|nr:hypothetical protein [Escherichia coli]